MTRAEFLDKQYSISVIAGMNQRYHQRYARWWWLLDTIAKIATAILAVIGAMLAVAAFPEHHNRAIDSLSVVIASLAAIAALILNVVPFGTWEKEYRDWFRKWSDLREDVEALLYECEGVPDEHHLADLKRLEMKLHRICGEEPSPNKALIDKCFAEENKSRLPAVASAA